MFNVKFESEFILNKVAKKLGNHLKKYHQISLFEFHQDCH